jgi:hypothetical protein
MAVMNWGAAGTRFYETGIDRGVLFPPSGIGVPWSGLTAVKEAPTGGDPKPYYIDGIKFLQIAANEEFNATITAYSAPREFAVCDGTGSLYAGLFATQQPRKQFNFSYRTMVGNDVDGQDHAYKIHLVYNALAKPSNQDNNSLSDSTDPNEFSWEITTVPVNFEGMKPTAHLFIDSRYVDPDVLQALEAMLYGTEFFDPKFPNADDLFNLFANYGNLVVEDLGNGHYTAEGEPVQIVNPSLNFTIDDPTVTDNGDGSFSIEY